jgi:hypothetical protein
MASVVPSQRWGITEGAPKGWVVVQKNGFADSDDHRWRLNSVGQVGDGWLVATFTDGWGSESAGIEGNRFLNRAISTALARVPVGPFPTAAAFVDRQFADVLGRVPTYDERLAWSGITQTTNAPASVVAWLLGLSHRDDGVAGDQATVNGIVVGNALLGRPWGPQPDRVAFIGAILGSAEYRDRIGR